MAVLVPAARASGSADDAVWRSSAFKAALNEAFISGDALLITSAIDQFGKKSSSAEIELMKFEVLFLAQKHSAYPKHFIEFTRHSETEPDVRLKSFYSELAYVYGYFVNYALNSELLKLKKEKNSVKYNIEILAKLSEKYLKRFEAARKDSENRKKSADFISYLEKKCADSEPHDGGANDSARSDFARQFEKYAQKSENLRLISCRYLLLLMLHKNLKGGGRVEKTAASLITGLFPPAIAEAYSLKPSTDIKK
ncbi:MAG TPA: hypothetical protein PKW98_03425 [Candidatus Wallbacteria bacterium]|nr:hypothetical protein [Candidatus Wallbacteria bacterium]